MKLEDQVVSLELSQKLKELGVKQEGLFHWARNIKNEFKLFYLFNFQPQKEEYIAFTVAELGVMLPEMCPTYRITGTADWSCVLEGGHHDKFQRAYTEANARATMLIYLIEQKIVDPLMIKESKRNE